MVNRVKSLRTQWFCGGSVFYAKRCRGGTELSVKITCDEKERDSLDRALEAKEIRERRESDHGGLHHHLIISKQCP